MSGGARLLIIERLLERNQIDPPGPLIDVTMMTYCSEGRQRSAAELRTLLTRAGLRFRRVLPTGVSDIVEGVAS
jgi:hypothetical protein